MTPEAQRIAIAEACGWHQKRMAENGPLFWNDGKKFRNEYEIPDYLNDLNAMHEAEKVLTIQQLRRMTVELHDIMTRDPKLDWIPVHHATAAQRAEAFLRTLRLWKDNQ